MATQMLADTINHIAQKGKGILAADESTKTIGKRFATIDTESTAETRRQYRSLLATTEGLGEFVSGVILFEETLEQKVDSGDTIPQAFHEQGIMPGIKVDKGLKYLPTFPQDTITQGLDDLADRLTKYKELGARFTKWRAVYAIQDGQGPSQTAVEANAESLARYAAICQAEGLVPIVEPELLMDGDHDLETCEVVSEHILNAVFDRLHAHAVELEHIILKPNMVIPAKQCADQSSPEAIAEATVRVLRRAVPSAVPTINFLSGGQSPEEATINLNAMNVMGPHPWQLSFSYGRALQEPCLNTWHGSADNVAAAKKALYVRCQLNSAAVNATYSKDQEPARA